MILEVEWDEKIYNVDVILEGLRDISIVFELPDGRWLKPIKWFPSKPPRPMSYKLVTDADSGCIKILEFVRDTPKKLPLTQIQVEQQKKVDGTLVVAVNVELEDILTYTRRGFDDFLDSMILGDSVWGRLRDIKYEVIGHSATNVRLLVTASIKT